MNPNTLWCNYLGNFCDENAVVVLPGCNNRCCLVLEAGVPIGELQGTYDTFVRRIEENSHNTVSCHIVTSGFTVFVLNGDIHPRFWLQDLVDAVILEDGYLGPHSFVHNQPMHIEQMEIQWAVDTLEDLAESMPMLFMGHANHI